MAVVRPSVIAASRPMVRTRQPITDLARLDHSPRELCAAFDITWQHQVSWGARSHLQDLLPGHPAFVIRQAPEGLSLDTQRWDISGGETCWPTTRILSLSLPWWRKLAEQPEGRCLIPLTACTATFVGRHGGDMRAAWFTLEDQPLFTVAGLWRQIGNARYFAMLGCIGDEPVPIMPVVIAPEHRTSWLQDALENATPLLVPYGLEQIRIGLHEPLMLEVAANGHAV